MSKDPFASDGDSDTDFDAEDNNIPKIEPFFTVYTDKITRTMLRYSDQTKKIDREVLPQNLCSAVRTFTNYYNWTKYALDNANFTNRNITSNNINYVDKTVIATSVKNLQSLKNYANNRLGLCGRILE